MLYSRLSLRSNILIKEGLCITIVYSTLFLRRRVMKAKYLYYFLSLLVAASVVLAACAPQVAATTAPAQTEEPAATEAAVTEAPTEAPTAAPTEAPTTERHGGWLDEIDVSVVDGAS